MQIIKTDEKTLARYAARTARRNERFKKLPIAKQRIAIARDVIEEYYEQHYNHYKEHIKSYKNNNRRLRMIMENIISNNGKFDPDRGRHANKPQKGA